jgi:hypothetical protein
MYGNQNLYLKCTRGQDNVVNITFVNNANASILYFVDKQSVYYNIMIDSLYLHIHEDGRLRLLPTKPAQPVLRILDKHASDLSNICLGSDNLAVKFRTKSISDNITIALDKASNKYIWVSKKNTALYNIHDNDVRKNLDISKSKGGYFLYAYWYQCV